MYGLEQIKEMNAEQTTTRAYQSALANVYDRILTAQAACNGWETEAHEALYEARVLIENVMEGATSNVQ